MIEDLRTVNKNKETFWKWQLRILSVFVNGYCSRETKEWGRKILWKNLVKHILHIDHHYFDQFFVLTTISLNLPLFYSCRRNPFRRPILVRTSLCYSRFRSLRLKCTATLKWPSQWYASWCAFHLTHQAWFMARYNGQATPYYKVSFSALTWDISLQ